MTSVYLADKRCVELSAQKFLAQGGEGSVYVDQDQVYKIYKEPTKTLAPQKIQELSVLDPDLFLRPEVHVFDDQGQAIGYGMRFVPQTVPLCKLFSASYKNRHQIDQSMILSLIEQLRRGIAQAHDHKILIVDLNDQNFLVSADHTQLFFIDVDSYQTPSFPATAIMDSVRDWHTLGDDAAVHFSPKTDWFAFAIICFQLLMGIHPYRGKHPYVRDMIKRMKTSVSVFDPQVSIPRVCPPLNTIPRPLYGWLKSILQDAQRSAPPQPLWLEEGQGLDHSASLDQYFESSSQRAASPLHVQEVTQVHGLIRAHSYDQGHRALIADHNVYLDQKLISIGAIQPRAVIFEAKTHRAAVVIYDQRQITLIDAKTGQHLGAPTPADQVSYDTHAVHLIYQGHYQELTLRRVGDTLIPIVKSKMKVMPHASDLFTGGIAQNMLGKYVFTALEAGHEIPTMRLPELDERVIIEAYYTRRVLMVKWRDQANSVIGRFRFKPSKYGAQSYHFDQIDQANLDRADLVVTPQGVAIWSRANGSLELFHVHADDLDTRVVPQALHGDEQLVIEGDAVVMMRHDKLYALTLKSS